MLRGVWRVQRKWFPRKPWAESQKPRPSCGRQVKPTCGRPGAAGLVGFVVLSAGSKGVEFWLVERADLGVVRLVEYVFVRGGCEEVEHCLAVGHLVDHRLQIWAF